MSSSDPKQPGYEFQQDVALDKPGIVGARWWHQGSAAGAVANLLTPSRFGGARRTPAYNECFVEVAPA